ncbi:MAG: FtsX-like permease family protein [Christensenellales bacterium]
MNRNSIFALAKQGLKANKKSTKTIIAMMAVSMIIIIPVFVLLMGVSVSMNAELNKAPYLLYLSASFEDYRQNEKGASRLAGYERADRRIVYEEYTLTDEFLSVEVNMIVEDREFSLAGETSNIAILDAEKSNILLPKNFDKAGGLFVEGCDEAFSGDGRGQIILSQALLDKLGLSAHDVYGKEVSIYANSRQQEVDGYVCYKYRVVGVIKSRFYNEFKKEMEHPMRSWFFVVDTNVYRNDEPVLRLVGGSEGYANIADKVALNQEQRYMMLDIGKSHFRNTSVYVEADSYRDLLLTKEGIADEHVGESAAFSGYRLLYKIAQSLGFMLMLTGIVLLIVTIAYYFLNVRFDVEKRKKYMMMLRAMGAQKQDLPKIYMVQAIIICAKASAIFATIGFGVCVGIKYAVNAVMKLGVPGAMTAISISWLSIIVPIIAMVALIFATAIFIGYASVKSVSKKEIIETLRGE